MKGTHSRSMAMKSYSKVFRDLVRPTIGLQQDIIDRPGDQKDVRGLVLERSTKQLHRRVESWLYQSGQEAKSSKVVLDEDIDTLFEEMDMNSVQYPCEATIIVPTSRG